MLSSKVKGKFLFSSKLVIQAFLTRHWDKMKSLKNWNRKLETVKCQGPRREVHMQAASQLLIVLINKCRGREEKVKREGGERGDGGGGQRGRAPSSQGKEPKCLVLKVSQFCISFPPHLCETQ